MRKRPCDWVLHPFPADILTAGAVGGGFERALLLLLFFPLLLLLLLLPLVLEFVQNDPLVVPNDIGIFPGQGRPFVKKASTGYSGPMCRQQPDVAPLPLRKIPVVL